METDIGFMLSFMNQHDKAEQVKDKTINLLSFPGSRNNSPNTMAT